MPRGCAVKKSDRWNHLGPVSIKTDALKLLNHYYQSAHHDVTVDWFEVAGQAVNTVGKSHQPGQLRRREAPQFVLGFHHEYKHKSTESNCCIKPPAGKSKTRRHALA
jgi:hypothetical protein